MKPNNLIALLIVAILLAVGIALAVINERSENANQSKATENTSSVTPNEFYNFI
jgi:hypothetical protein